ncbi:hypothetical protein C0Z18_31940 [Trinickia dabaoshanensis]|uniref:Uncharacterized protein n=1 Tax=Trinickia dabaoshanensis TaxID=564714 RepID=A0A2N7VB44_9BURK|nr:hypothetical protein C0Z18_31940 [Trinickia dabaoshanensis]
MVLSTWFRLACIADGIAYACLEGPRFVLEFDLVDRIALSVVGADCHESYLRIRVGVSQFLKQFPYRHGLSPLRH